MKDRQTEEVISFENWFRILARMAVHSYGFEISPNSADAWKDYYDNGFTPREAIDEDTYAGI